MSSKFLDKTGLDTLWAKIKSTFQTLGNLVTAWGSTPSDTKYPSEKLVKTALDGKVDKETGKGLSTNDYTTDDKNKVASAVQPSDSRLTRSVWSGGLNAVCGYKICTTSKIAGVSGQASNIYAIVMGSMCLTNKYASQPQGSDSSGVDGALAMGSFMIWCEGKPDGTITARARLFSSDAAFNNADIAICKKYVNGAVEWFVAFGPWDSSKAVTASRTFGMSVCFDYVQNASVPGTLEAVPSGYGYEDYYLLWKHPYLKSTQQGAGSTARPVYVTANGEVKECKKLVQAVTSINTSDMYPDVLYVM